MDGASCSHETASDAGSASESNGNGAGTTEEAEGEEGDDSSSSSSLLVDADQDLDEFRRRWQRELGNSTCTDILNKNCIADRVRQEMHVEDQARELYLQGVEAERRGHLYEAIFFYRRAVQLVPDIEFRVAELLPNYKKDDEDQNSEEDSADDDNEYDVDVARNRDIGNEENVEDFIARFARLCNRAGKTCHPVFDQKASHVSVLPREILLYIWKWVASSDLDMRSLEQLALVCRGFYLCSRDAELWRLACMRVWGGNCGSPNKYGSWREMFIKRPRLRYNGAYISKTTYIRPGEPAFQDQTYRPWHIVDYYRYLRFFPEGIVLMMTTPEEPVLSLAKLRQRGAKHQAILSGHYRLHGDMVTAILRRTKISDVPISTVRYRRLRQVQQPQDHGEQTFHLELQVMTYKNRSNYKLEWCRYSVHTVYRNGHESVCDFDLSHSKFPPFWFSRVKSYTAVSEKPLQ